GPHSPQLGLEAIDALLEILVTGAEAKREKDRGNGTEMGAKASHKQQGSIARLARPSTGENALLMSLARQNRGDGEDAGGADVTNGDGARGAGELEGRLGGGEEAKGDPLIAILHLEDAPAGGW